MKISSLITIFTASAIAIGTVINTQQPGWTQNTRGFYCDTSTGKPITMYRNDIGGIEPWIRWTSNLGGYDSLTRCREVSGRLETYRQQKRLRFITVGIMNRQRVVCTASQFNGRCEGLIYTLKPKQDAVTTLNNLLAWREGRAGTPSLYESGEIPYIDVSSYLGEDNTPAPSTNNSQPAPQQPSPGNLREL
ncbi:COP23 domain-containing protein [Nostoc sp. UHCC 0870]|uniref:COP23 domain-containing protein n=1 Tax=Nostoc sp. UHCC 0870 TaxID=2914041 RepID=UPI001EDDD437|nr:COP23 domain-containing protein [Nostoc sp. UHCC 0870]UKO99314.1 COP23 domain-containing protein [Nostoc sp. UHCC 0870]